MSTEVVMPQMGESITEGTITKWLKQVGERVERDEPLFEISTDKVDAEIPSPAAGTLAEVRFKEGDTVEVNTVVAVLDSSGAGASETVPPAAIAEPPKSETAPAAPAPSAAAAPSPPSPPPQMRAAAPVKTEAVTPKLQQTPVQAETTAETPAVRANPAPAAGSAGNGSSTATAEELRKTKSSPLVRKIAEEHGVDIAKLDGTGMSGRVTKNDIMSFIESGAQVGAVQAKAATPTPAQAHTQAPAPVASPELPPSPVTKPGEGDRVEPMTLMRKKIAEHMLQSRRTSAHVTTVYEIDMTTIAKLRDQHKDSFLERTGTKLTFMPFIFQAVNRALRKFPVFNAQVSADQIVYKRDINLGMAVALDWGLIVPVIKRADDLSISGLARAANDLAERARTKQLKPDEVAGGTFTITNPGVFGGLFGTPIINQPQLAILGVGKIEKRAKVITAPDGEDYIAIRWMAYFALSFDHRVIDGADAERFLAYVKEVLEAGDFAL
jgi:pyruvate dehydrogenase E2 component (dihydrolipoamide acetyltransferase)